MENNNKGLTLVELIVVIAIMAVLTASFTLSFTLIGRQKVSNAASSTKQMLQLAQTYSRSKDCCLVEIKGSSNKGSELYIYTYDSADASDRSKWKLGNGPKVINEKITTQVEYANGNVVTVDSTHEVLIKFNRSTGGFEKVQVPGQASGVESEPVKIIFTNGQKTSTLLLATHTGVVTYE